MKQGSTLSYLHHDHLGSLVAATDTSGAEVGGAAWARYSPFGQLRLSGGTLPSDRLFTGQTRDNVLGACLTFPAPYRTLLVPRNSKLLIWWNVP